MNTYCGYKLLDKIILVCQDLPEKTVTTDNIYKAYLVDPSNKTQLKSARQWAAWTEYGPSRKNNNGKWEHEYTIKHEPVEFEFDNNGFTLKLLDCAGGSSQGGKLSFWNCLVKKDDKTFKIGINSDMLLDLLKDNIFYRGACSSPLIFITQNGKVGMTAEGSDTYKQCVADMELKNTVKSGMVSKFEFGDILKTTTLEEVYLGTIYQYYAFDPGSNAYRCSNYYDLRDCTLTKLAKPIKYHVFDTITCQTKLSEFLNHCEHSQYSYPDFKKSCPKRVIDGKIELDITQEDFYKQMLDKIYAFDSWVEYYMKHYLSPTDTKAYYYFLSSRIFGVGTDPFELDAELMRKIKSAGVKYTEE